MLWIPAAAYCLIASILHPAVTGSPFYILFGYLGGLFFWTLAEYLLHRFVLYFPVKTPGKAEILSNLANKANLWLGSITQRRHIWAAVDAELQALAIDISQCRVVFNYSSLIPIAHEIRADRNITSL